MVAGTPARSPSYRTGPCTVMVFVSGASVGGRAWISDAREAAGLAWQEHSLLPKVQLPPDSQSLRLHIQG